MADIEVLGAGFGRTGTLSLSLALNTLGYKTHHMKEVVGNPAQGAAWLQATRDRAAGRPIDLRAILAGYTAAVDWPAVGFLHELLELYPQAKVVLTIRDFDSWYESARTTIFAINQAAQAIKPPFYLAPFFRDLTNMFSMAYELVFEQAFGGRFNDKEAARQVYEAHLAEVRRLVPKERLLEFSVADGWGPLCDFLGKPVPEEPFPRANDRAQFTKLAQVIRRNAARLRLLFAASNAAAVAGIAAAVALAVNLLRH
ncbi:hypothetical protein GPECTOR_43g893 [Gonium pectorale]|uniref:Sulfotransferase n=1 Tax=Gonium pectorale TaxID=33097 RepID=A0A150G9D2_GONPE|nr:hypothetical protein GPECTOR_43g893 [Gonium pectorale]|eukprot:KXZ46457.1 hypothetical protein GPECTOR_43g893 [Gonium pectorale]